MDPKDRPPGTAGMLASEAGDKYAKDRESDMHSRFMGYCGLKGILVEHEKPTKRSTSVPGWPDFRLFYRERRFLAIEFKVKPNGLTKEQEEIRAMLEAFGFRYVVAYSLAEAIHAAQEYLIHGRTV